MSSTKSYRVVSCDAFRRCSNTRCAGEKGTSSLACDRSKESERFCKTRHTSDRPSTAVLACVSPNLTKSILCKIRAEALVPGGRGCRDVRRHARYGHDCSLLLDNATIKSTTSAQQQLEIRRPDLKTNVGNIVIYLPRCGVLTLPVFRTWRSQEMYSKNRSSAYAMRILRLLCGASGSRRKAMRERTCIASSSSWCAESNHFRETGTLFWCFVSTKFKMPFVYLLANTYIQALTKLHGTCACDHCSRGCFLIIDQ